MRVEKVQDVTDEIFSAVCRLVPELGAHKPLPTRNELIALVRSEASTLWLARYPDRNGTIAGMLTISLYRVPTGLRSIVEDVAVDSNFRRKGIGRALMQTAIDFARACGANGIALTSNPRREAANRLYLSMGFERRETNSYFYRL
ncbi:MAG: GNAT family N-acetyltransferase [Anaerolineales bacterium]|nr:GNAT family N-acetyltransferase [Anaerolineales bacterium]